MGEPAAVIPAVTPSTVAFVRSLGRRGVRTIVVAHDESAPSFRSRYCDESVLVTDPREDLAGYKDALLALAMRPDVETIVPLREADVYVLSKHRSEFGAHVETPWPSFDTLRTAQDRERLFDVARAAGVSVPETKPLDEVDDWGRELVVKSRYALLTDEHVPDGSGQGIVEVGSAMFLGPHARLDEERVRAAFKHDPHVQRFVHGTEYSIGVLYRDGEPVVETQKRIIRGTKYYHGPSVYHESVDVPELEAVGRRLLTALDWHGPADVDVILDEETGEFVLLEVNPRFWATIQLEIHAGFDFPDYYWRMVRGEAEHELPEPEPGIASHFLPGELSYLHSVLRDDHSICDRPSVPSTVWEQARSIVEAPRFDLLARDDPLPFVAVLANDFRGVRSSG